VSFSLDHAAILAFLDNLWAFVNVGNVAAIIISAICIYGVYQIFRNLSDDNG